VTSDKRDHLTHSYRRLHTCGPQIYDNLSLAGALGLVRFVPSLSIGARPSPTAYRGRSSSKWNPHETNRLSRRRGTHQDPSKTLWPSRRSAHTGSSEARADPANNTRTCNKLRRSTG
jgi:hypothetical protein